MTALDEIIEESTQIKNWVAVLESVTFCMPNGIREKVIKNLLNAEIKRPKDRIFKTCSFNELCPTDGISLRGRAMEIKSMVVQVLVRQITNSHSPENAAKLLFRRHRDGTGSGWLQDYLVNLPGIVIKREKCKSLADSK